MLLYQTISLYTNKIKEINKVERIPRKRRLLLDDSTKWKERVQRISLSEDSNESYYMVVKDKNDNTIINNSWRNNDDDFDYISLVPQEAIRWSIAYCYIKYKTILLKKIVWY